MTYAEMKYKDLRNRLENQPDSPDFKHAYAELEIRRQILQLWFSALVLLFTGTVALATIWK
jgi:hypothetical protein